MKKHKLLKIEKKTNNKWLNLYSMNYEKEEEYFMASRNEPDNLVAVKKTNMPDAVKMLPYFYKNDEVNVVFIKEFRKPLNKHIYDLPAGLVDDGEAIEDSAIRELKEEIGATTKNIKSLCCGFTSAGLTDERLHCFFVEIENEFDEQNLELDEDIEIIVVKFDDMIDFVKKHDNEISLTSALLIRLFYSMIMCKLSENS